MVDILVAQVRGIDEWTELHHNKISPQNLATLPKGAKNPKLSRGRAVGLSLRHVGVDKRLRCKWQMECTFL